MLTTQRHFGGKLRKCQVKIYEGHHVILKKIWYEHFQTLFATTDNIKVPAELETPNDESKVYFSVPK